jgi:hypothetical protein
MITAVAERCRRQPSIAPPLIVERVDLGKGAEARAGYIPGLAKYLGAVPEGAAFHFVLADSDGWTSSEPMFAYPEDEDAPAYLEVPDHVRAQFSTTLMELLRCSPPGRVILVLEYNGAVTSPDPDEAASVDVDVVGPMSTNEFWRRHDLHELVEESIIILERSSRR